MATIKKAQNGDKATKKPATKKPTSRKMSEAQLSALAHQKRGMGPIDNTYVKKPGAIMNELGTLNEDQVKQLKNYMNKSSTAEKIYQALPNVGRLFGKSAADVPSKKTGGAVKKKMQTGGSIGSKVVKENPRQQKRLSRIKKNNPERTERVEKRMVKRADRAMGARGAASRMKTGGKVAKKK